MANKESQIRDGKAIPFLLPGGEQAEFWGAKAQLTWRLPRISHAPSVWPKKKWRIESMLRLSD